MGGSPLSNPLRSPSVVLQNWGCFNESQNIIRVKRSAICCIPGYGEVAGQLVRDELRGSGRLPGYLAPGHHQLVAARRPPGPEVLVLNGLRPRRLVAVDDVGQEEREQEDEDDGDKDQPNGRPGREQDPSGGHLSLLCLFVAARV